MAKNVCGQVTVVDQLLSVVVVVADRSRRGQRKSARSRLLVVCFHDVILGFACKEFFLIYPYCVRHSKLYFSRHSILTLFDSKKSLDAAIQELHFQ